MITSSPIRSLATRRISPTTLKTESLSSALRISCSFSCSFAAASPREFDVLLFWSLDRLSREGTVETLNHLQRLTGYGVNYRSFTEQYLDSTGIFKEAVIGILAAVEQHCAEPRLGVGIARGLDA